MCHPIVSQCLDGYNGTIFCYGQTGSGKTHSMLGTSFDQGILLSAVQEIFDYAGKNIDTREISIWASYLEIYNENINDLLDQNNINLKIREDPSEGCYVSGLKTLKIIKVEDFKKLIKLGEKARHYRATNANENSSRSHTIFRIVIENRLNETKKLVMENNMKDHEDSNDEIA